MSQPKVKTPKDICEGCGASITRTQMHSHAGSKACRFNSMKRIRDKISSESYVRFSQYEEVAKLVNLWAIPEGKIVASQFDAYVPKWIADAVVLFKKNKGYAEMNMIDFINRMRPV